VPSTGARSDPALGFRFEVTLDDLAVGGFSECSGLQSEIEVYDHPEGGVNSHLLKFPTRAKQSNLTLRRGIAGRVLWDWHAELVQGRITVRDGSIRVRDPEGQAVVVEWQFRQAFPCKWVGPELNATQSAVAVDSFELCHQGLERTV
jgi:phage tail-like protein